MGFIKKATVFCASSNNCDVEYLQLASNFGKILASSGITILYGGGKKGLMGKLADSALKHKGRVIGYIPEDMFSAGLGNDKATELVVVPNIHIREENMMKEADAIFVLPGGIGTLEESFQALAWNFLGLIDVPVVFVNYKGYFDDLLKVLNKSVKDNFMPDSFADFIIESEEPEYALQEAEKVLQLKHSKHLSSYPNFARG